MQNISNIELSCSTPNLYVKISTQKDEKNIYHSIVCQSTLHKEHKSEGFLDFFQKNIQIWVHGHP